MKKLALALFLLMTPSLAQAADASSTAYIHKEIDKLSTLFNDGLGGAERKRRHIVFAPMFGEDEDGEAAIAFFTIQGISMMNGFEEYMAVFRKGQGRSTPSSAEKPYRLIAAAQIGTRWGRTFDWKTVKVTSGEVSIRGMKWSDDDAGCCPSMPILVTFALTPAAGHETRYPLWRETEAIVSGKGAVPGR